MKHYEQRLKRDLEAIHERVEEVGSWVEDAVTQSVRSLLSGDRALAYEIVLGDLAINRAVRSIDQLCHAFVARHLPSAGHLRFVSSVLRLGIALERIGDYAVTLCREAVQLTAPPPASVAKDVKTMAAQAHGMLVKAMKAFNEGDAELARETKSMEEPVDVMIADAFGTLLKEAEAGSRPIKDLFAMLVALNRLERVSDQAKNICEETLFAVAGETKAPKVYRVLFVDEKNDLISQMAEAYARKAFPSSGTYASAGLSPASSLHSELASFMDQHGFDLDQAAPTPLPRSTDELAAYHVVVSLAGDLRPHLEGIPFHTIFLEWELELDASPGLRGTLEEALRGLSVRIRNLMEALRGEGAG